VEIVGTDDGTNTNIRQFDFYTEDAAMSQSAPRNRPPVQRASFNELIEVVQQALVPLYGQFGKLEDRFEELQRTQATRADVDSLRQHMQSSFDKAELRYVPREALEPRLASLQEQLSVASKRVEHEVERRERLLEKMEADIEKRFSEAGHDTISKEERAWTRASIAGALAFGFLGFLFALVQLIVR
jgi:hypothetical protein